MGCVHTRTHSPGRICRRHGRAADSTAASTAAAAPHHAARRRPTACCAASEPATCGGTRCVSVFSRIEALSQLAAWSRPMNAHPAAGCSAGGRACWTVTTVQPRGAQQWPQGHPKYDDEASSAGVPDCAHHYSLRQAPHLIEVCKEVGDAGAPGSVRHEGCQRLPDRPPPQLPTAVAPQLPLWHSGTAA